MSVRNEKGIQVAYFGTCLMFLDSANNLHFGIACLFQNESPLAKVSWKSIEFMVLVSGGGQDQQKCRDWEGLTDELVYWDIQDPRLHDKPRNYQLALQEINARLKLWITVKTKAMS